MTRLVSVRPLLALFFLVLLMLAAAPAPAGAQGFVSPLIGFDFGGDSGCPEISECEDKNLNIAVGVGSLGNIFGTEFEFTLP